MKKNLSIAELAAGILEENRIILARAITMAESTRREDRENTYRLLNELMPNTGKSIRIGITGVPGVGKSTFIDALGRYIINEKKGKVAVLAVDPSSSISGGSILGDKTRMANLSVIQDAFIRPSPSSGTLGGVGAKTRETMLLCEAAGFDHIIIETVGVGQSETLVHNMVDFFLLLMLSGAGDELQGIKRGIMEMCNALVINKADGENEIPAKRAAMEYANALHLFNAHESGWPAKVSTCSSINNKGIAEVYGMIKEYLNLTRSNGFFDKNREDQQVLWFENALYQSVLEEVKQHPLLKENLEKFRQMARSSQADPAALAHNLLREIFSSALKFPKG